MTPEQTEETRTTGPLLEGASALEDAGEETEFEEDFSGAGRGLGFTAAALVAGFAIIGYGFYWLREIVDRGYVEQLLYVYRDASLLPERPEDGLRRIASERSIRVYYTHDGRTLSPQERTLRGGTSAPAERARLILEQLFAPESNSLFRTPLPAGTKLRGFFILGSVAYVDLSEEFVKPDGATPRGERLAVYSVVNSLVLGDVGLTSVQLLVGGQPIQSAWGWLDCSTPLGPNLSIIEKT